MLLVDGRNVKHAGLWRQTDHRNAVAIVRGDRLAVQCPADRQRQIAFDDHARDASAVGLVEGLVAERERHDLRRNFGRVCYLKPIRIKDIREGIEPKRLQETNTHNLYQLCCTIDHQLSAGFSATGTIRCDTLKVPAMIGLHRLNVQRTNTRRHLQHIDCRRVDNAHIVVTPFDHKRQVALQDHALDGHHVAGIDHIVAECDGQYLRRH